MQLQKSLGKTLALTLGLGLLSGLATSPVLAQDSSPDMGGQSAMLRDELDPTKGPVERHDADIRDIHDAPDPMPLNYPYAAPGTLHLYHWTDYTKWTVRQGSVSERREHIRRIVDVRRRMDRERYMALLPAEEKNEEYYARHADPMPLNYPYAAPGTLALYHWTDYTKWNWAQGSPEEIREMQDRDRSRKIYDELAATDKILGINEDQYAMEHADPMPMNYPYAAPGTLALYHWTDYTKWNWAQGSPQEIRDQMAREHDRKRREEMARNRQILQGSGSMSASR